MPPCEDEGLLAFQQGDISVSRYFNMLVLRYFESSVFQPRHSIHYPPEMLHWFNKNNRSYSRKWINWQRKNSCWHRQTPRFSWIRSTRRSAPKIR